MIERIKETLAKEQVNEFLKKMSAIGCTPQEVVELMKRAIEEEKEQ